MTNPTDGRAEWTYAAVPQGPGLSPLPGWFWDSPEVREAAAKDKPGAVIALARQAHGLRQGELGALAGFSQPAISRLESGGNIGFDLRVLRAFQRLLGIPPHLLGIAEGVFPVEPEDARWLMGPIRPGEPAANAPVALDHRSLLDACAAAVFGGLPADAWKILDEGRPFDPDMVHRLLVVRRLVNESDFWLGPGNLAPAVREICGLVDQMRRTAKGEARRRLLDVGALYAEFHGWLCQELGDMRGAAEWTERALQQAQAADDRELVAYVYVRMAQLAESDQDDDRMIGLSRAAQREHGLTPQVRALAAQQEARGHALSGDVASCMEKFEEARSFGLPTTFRWTDEYRVGYYFDENHLTVGYAASLLDLGRAHDAIACYEENRDSRERICRWEQGVHVAKLAHAYALTGELERAASLGAQALALGEGAGFAMVQGEIGKLAAWNATPAIAEITGRRDHRLSE